MKRERLFLSRSRFIGTAPKDAEIRNCEATKYLLKCGEIVGKMGAERSQTMSLFKEKGDISKKLERVTFLFNANIILIRLFDCQTFEEWKFVEFAAGVDGGFGTRLELCVDR